MLPKFEPTAERASRCVEAWAHGGAFRELLENSQFDVGSKRPLTPWILAGDLDLTHLSSPFDRIDDVLHLLIRLQSITRNDATLLLLRLTVMSTTLSSWRMQYRQAF